MQEKITVHQLLINPLNMWHWEQQYKIRIAFTKKLKAGSIQGVFAIIPFVVPCLPICYLKKFKIKISKT
jgi:hypothetical protein